MISTIRIANIKLYFILFSILEPRVRVSIMLHDVTWCHTSVMVTRCCHGHKSHNYVSQWNIVETSRRMISLQYYNSVILGLIKEENLVLGLTQENSIENSVQNCLPYILLAYGPCFSTLAYPK